jgi:pyruvate dehydrogenase E2 component (dihydrolipoamide acetyltransferase)
LLALTQEELEKLQKEGAPFAVAEEEAALGDEPRPIADAPPQKKERAPASPAARRLAKELGVDLATVSRTGSSGRITEGDVQKYLDSAPRPPRITPIAREMIRQMGLDISQIMSGEERGKITKKDVEQALVQLREQEKKTSPVKTIPFEGKRKSIAEHMYGSMHNTAQATVFVEIDTTEMIRFRELVLQANRKNEGLKLSLTDILILATSRGLKQHPIMNATLIENQIVLNESVNMGIAVDIPDGLMVPVLHNADNKGLLQIAEESRKLAKKAREGSLLPEEVFGGTFTISNVSMFNVDGATPILKHPETGILVMGRVKEKPAVWNGNIVIRPLAFLSLTFDHRVVDGGPAIRFLETVALYLEHPTLIMT